MSELDSERGLTSKQHKKVIYGREKSWEKLECRIKGK